MKIVATIREKNGRRILTSKQLATAYGVDEKRIARNYSNNSERYEEGKHYFKLTGKEKNDFLFEVKITPSNRSDQPLYLWTEKGAFLHAKSLGTDQAWNVYDALIDQYFQLKDEQEQILPSIDAYLVDMQRQMYEISENVKSIDAAVQKVDQKLGALERDVQELEKNFDGLKQEVAQLKVKNLVQTFFEEGAKLSDLENTAEE